MQSLRWALCAVLVSPLLLAAGRLLSKHDQTAEQPRAGAIVLVPPHDPPPGQVAPLTRAPVVASRSAQLALARPTSRQFRRARSSRERDTCDEPAGGLPGLACAGRRRQRDDAACARPDEGHGDPGGAEADARAQRRSRSRRRRRRRSRRRRRRRRQRRSRCRRPRLRRPGRQRRRRRHRRHPTPPTPPATPPTPPVTPTPPTPTKPTSPPPVVTPPPTTNPGSGGTNSDSTRPGNGYGDHNHEHTGSNGNGNGHKDDDHGNGHQGDQGGSPSDPPCAKPKKK